MITNRVSVIIGEKRMNVSETAKLAGLSYNTVDSIYRDLTKGIEFDTLDKLCFALNCTPNDLFKYTPD